MKAPKTTLALFIAFIFNTLLFAGNPPKAQQLLNHNDWSFSENKGQLFDEKGKSLTDIKYYGRQAGVNIYCRQGKISFVFTKKESEGQEISEATGTSSDASKDIQIKISAQRADLVLAGANQNAEMLASEQQSYYENYYTYHTPEHGITQVHTFKTITYKNVYPHIDMVLHARDQGMKYEFVVHPGGLVSDIQLQWSGLTNMAIVGNGGISYDLDHASFQESKPISFQDGNKIQIESKFVLGGNTIAFKVADYDINRDLVIDPSLTWATYYGGTSFEEGHAISIDGSGNIYLGGFSSSTSGIATSGVYQTSLYASNDAFVVRLNSSGGRDWGSYLGGESNDYGYGLSVDGSHNVFLTGITHSLNNMATSGSYQSKLSGNYAYGDAFLAKFNSSGALTWSTYYGGTNYDTPYGAITDGSGNVYIAGSTNSSSGIASSSGYQTSGGGTYTDAFLAKFSSSGSLSWATYYGGSATDIAYGLNFDANGNIYITGATASSSGIASSGAYRTSLSGSGTNDVFLAKFTAIGKFVWGTYYGGSSNDEAHAISADANGNVFITGFALSTYGIATSGAYLTSGGGTYKDAFLAKFNGNGELSWGTYYGGSDDDEGWGLAVDKDGYPCVTGYTKSTSKIATSGGYLTYGGGSSGSDVFVAKFGSGSILAYATYYGGSASDQAMGIIADASGNMLVCGTTISSSGIATSGALQSSFAGNTDAFVIKFQMKPVNDAGIVSVLTPLYTFCAGQQTVKVQLLNNGSQELDSVKINWSVNRKIQAPYKWKGKLKSDSTVAVSIGTFMFASGKDTIKVWSSIPNGLPELAPNNDSTFTIDSIIALPPVNPGKAVSICKGSSTTLGAAPIFGYYYSWTSRPVGFISSKGNPSVSPSISTTYYLTITSAATGCQNTDSVQVGINPNPVASTGSPRTICEGDIIAIGATAVSGSTYSWVSDPVGYSSTSASPSISPKINTTYILTETITATGCKKTDSVLITANPLPAALVGGTQYICFGTSTAIGGKSVNGHVYDWSSNPPGFNSSVANPTVSPKLFTYYHLKETITATGCSKTDSVKVIINQLPDANVGSPSSICAGASTVIGLAAINGESYSWTSTIAGFKSGKATLSVSPTTTTVYYLKETNSNNCSNSDSVIVTVNPLPDSHWGDSSKCNRINFMPRNFTYKSYKWYFGDGDSSSLLGPAHMYTSIGSYQVKLISTTAQGCTSEYDSGVMVNCISGIIPVKNNAANISVYPNPFKSSISITYELTKSSNVQICIYDMTGKQISIITQGNQVAGKYNYDIDGDKLGLKAGLYIVRFIADDSVLSRSIVKIEK